MTPDLRSAESKATMNELDLVFKRAKEKAVSRINKAGNTAAPWDDFSTDHLKFGLINEYGEWRKTGYSDELLDIINFAAFVYLAQRGPRSHPLYKSWRDFYR